LQRRTGMAPKQLTLLTHRQGVVIAFDDVLASVDQMASVRRPSMDEWSTSPFRRVRETHQEPRGPSVMNQPTENANNTLNWTQSQGGDSGLAGRGFECASVSPP